MIHFGRRMRMVIRLQVLRVQNRFGSYKMMAILWDIVTMNQWGMWQFKGEHLRLPLLMEVEKATTLAEWDAFNSPNYKVNCYNETFDR
jgi:hypothetical protein